MSGPLMTLPEMVAAYSRYELCPPTDDEFRRVAAWMMYLASRMVYTTRQTDALRRFADSGRGEPRYIAALYPEVPFAAVACWVAGIDARSEVQAYCALLADEVSVVRVVADGAAS